jgi:chromosome segregation ATPase
MFGSTLLLVVANLGNTWILNDGSFGVRTWNDIKDEIDELEADIAGIEVSIESYEDSIRDLESERDGILDALDRLNEELEDLEDEENG